MIKGVQTKEKASGKIRQLIEKYKFVVSSGKLKSYTEEETKKDFILPLFQILGWDIFDKKEVTAEESQSGGRVDYGFYLDERLKFYLEAKSLKSDLHREDYANQVIKYSWNKGVTWAVLTDFERIKIFNAQVIERQLADKLFFEIPCEQYVERLDRLWLLSKEAFQDNLIDKEAEKFGKKLQRVSVSTLLYKDLNECRNILTHNLSQWNPKVDKDLLDEGVQKLLDRLIFLRVAEDRGIEPPTLIPLIRRWESRGGKEHLYQSMVEKFRELDEIYNSNLFFPHPFEKWEEYSGVTERVAKILYGKQGYYEYDFKAMPADVLGSVYENYLGYRLSQLQKGVSISKDAKKRKEQGIYYTPSFIVDYIVKNALEPVLDKCKSIEDLKKIKILDPACGSGSFLIKAMDLIYEKYQEFGNQGGVYTKLSILLDNIYGVDLDPQAVEIARLNLLLNTLEGRAKLPFLDRNIKNGNSLILGTDEELKKYFGKNFRDKKPFNWEEEFPEVFKQGGFDVIIGNPPWGAELTEQEKVFFRDRYITAKGIIDTFALFIERAGRFLKNDDYLGFILPDIVLLKNYPSIRKYILDNFAIKNAVHSGMVFKGVNLDSAILIIKKEGREKNRSANMINVIKNVDNFENQRWETSKIKQSVFERNDNYKFNLYLTDENIRIKDELNKISLPLDAIGEAHEGIHSGNIRSKLFIDSEINEKSKKLLFRGEEISPFSIEWGGKYVSYDVSIINKKEREYANLARRDYFEKPKILIRRTGDKIIAMTDENHYYASNNFFVFQASKNPKYNLKYLLLILNSRLITWYFLTIQPRKGKLFAEVKIEHLNQFPIHKIDFSDKNDREKHDEFVRLANNLIALHEELQETPENSNNWNGKKVEIERMDKKVNEEVYKLYGLTPEEIAIVEGNNNG